MTATRPQVIGQRYFLQRQIGRGGMGAVWLAVDDVLGREVAIKQIGAFPSGGSPDLVRAQREAKLAARLNHPHVVAVFDFVSEGDQRWLVMEYVEGTDLLALLGDHGGLRPLDAAALVGQVADALSSAHAHGIVHRDVKPSNILVTREGQAKLADFGIARARDSTLTASGQVTGSPAYLAPEVASGGPATEASDVWSLGATLYHALEGRPPYDTTDSALSAMYRIVHEEPPRLPGVGWPAELLETTMTTDPEARWSMDRVRDYLMSGPPQASSAATVVQPAPLALDSETEPDHELAEVPAEGDDHARRRGATVLLVVAAMVLLALVVGWIVLRQEPGGVADDGPRNQSSAPYGSPDASPTPTPKTSRSPSETSSEPAPQSTQESSPTLTPPPTTAATGAPPNGGQGQVAAMRAFVQDYVATALADPASSWQQLTPRFQQDCCEGSVGSYAGYWNTIATATLRDIVVDPAAMQVSYIITWDPEGERAPEDELVTLLLVKGGDRYLIDEER